MIVAAMTEIVEMIAEMIPIGGMTGPRPAAMIGIVATTLCAMTIGIGAMIVTGAMIALVAVFLPGFLILIGVLLVAEGFGTKMNKGYIYFAMAFSLVVEIVNMRVRPAHTPITSDD